MPQLKAKAGSSRSVRGCIAYLTRDGRALGAGSVRKVFLADDADPRLTDPLCALCAGLGVELERGDMTQEEFFQKIVELNSEESREVLQK